ncbi:MAG: serine/threonine-protein kinase, partial [Pseudomonadota bacterium]
MFVGEQLGRYHLLDRIAIGGMAEIYKATTFDARGKTHVVAIKRLLSCGDAELIKMLVDEAKTVAFINHPNIAKVFEFAQVGEEHFIAMEYVAGKDMRTIINRCQSLGTQFPIDASIYVMTQVMDALHAAHEQCDGAGVPLNIVHRDVSPSNIMVTYDGQVKLCDFGIAKTKLSQVQTKAGIIKGKVRYMSPEQTMGKKLDRRSDIFSAGSVLYEMLTEHVPFEADNEVELILRVRETKFVRPSRIHHDIPDDLDKIFKIALARSETRRFQTAADFSKSLRNFLKKNAPDYCAQSLRKTVHNLFPNEIQDEIGQVDPAA